MPNLKQKDKRIIIKLSLILQLCAERDGIILISSFAQTTNKNVCLNVSREIQRKRKLKFRAKREEKHDKMLREMPNLTWTKGQMLSVNMNLEFCAQNKQKASP